MTVAILSFATRVPRGRVMFRCDELRMDEARDLEVNPPFADWTRAYATGHWSDEALLGIGVAIGRWLEGSQRWLTRLREGIAPVILVVETRRTPDPVEQAALDAPWELIAHPGTDRANQTPTSTPVGAPVPPAVTQLLARLGAVDLRYARHMALEPGVLLTVVRRLGPVAQPAAPSRHRLSVVFMAAQPAGMTSLDVEREERAIRDATGGIGMDLGVEDSGSLEGLGDLVARTDDCDVIHVSCLGATGHRPALALEGKLGECVHATASDIWGGVGQKPRLMFVSACSPATPGMTADQVQAQEASTVALGSGVLWPLSAELCQRGWPAVLGLSCTVDDGGAIELAAALYRQLAQRVSLVEAFGRARAAVAMTRGRAVWHKARLFLGPGGGGKIVDGTGMRPARPDYIQDDEFLDSNKRIRIAASGQPAMYRRSFQRVVAALREGSSPGVVIHGGDELSRVTFVGRVLRRMERELRRVVVTRDFDAPAILGELREQTARQEVAAIVEEYRDRLHDDPAQLREALRAIIEGPCRDRGAGAFVLVLHDLDLMARPDLLLVVRALLGAFTGAGTASRLLFTCAIPFSVFDQRGNDLSHLLSCESLEVSAGRSGAAGGTGGAEPEPPGVIVDATAGTRSTEPTRPDAVMRLRAVRSLWRWVLIAGAGVGLAVGLLPRLFTEAARRPPARQPPPGMVRFPSATVRLGVFAAGSRPAECRQLSAAEDCAELERPDRVGVTRVAPFDLDQREVTNEEFSTWLNTNVDLWKPPGEDGVVVTRRRPEVWLVQTKECRDGLTVTPDGRARTTAGAARWPVVCVTWYAADSYCRAQGKRLPLEAEWELAAKGAESRPFPWGRELPRPGGVAFGLRDGPQSHPGDVGSSPQDVSPDGIHDLGGNVAEWVDDGHADREDRMFRGGSFWSDGPCHLLSSGCARTGWNKIKWDVGFRCARSVND
jgi:formylglycine-generating enzyme required for sulfatase activity